MNFSRSNSHKLLLNIRDIVIIKFHSLYIKRQSNVERGFNINGDILVENLKKESLIAHQLIYDHMHARKVGAHDIVSTDKLWGSCQASSSKRKQILAENKKEKSYLKRERRKKGLWERHLRHLREAWHIKYNSGGET